MNLIESKVILTNVRGCCCWTADNYFWTCIEYCWTLDTCILYDERLLLISEPELHSRTMITDYQEAESGEYYFIVFIKPAFYFD